MPSQKLHLSPSEHHEYLRRQITPALGYSGSDVVAWQQQLRPKLRTLVGDMPDTPVPLNVRHLWRREHALGAIEKIVFSAEPFCDVPAYVSLPKNATPPYTLDFGLFCSARFDINQSDESGSGNR